VGYFAMSLLFTSQGKPLTLAAKLGEGGEGSVYNLNGLDSYVAKIYHQPITTQHAEKLMLMKNAKTDRLLNVTAWPIDILYNTPTQKTTVGFIMPKVTGYKPVHELYSPRSRKQEFPKADWRFLIHVATNIARSFAVVHEHNHTIGDVNHGNIVVSSDGTVKLIDCDSFQILNNNRVFLCEVGVPEYTPPELQEKSFSSIKRTFNHDSFGLGIAIFQLLMMGRHPFAGQFLGGESPLETSIKEFRFAYGDLAVLRQMRQPPNTLPISSLSSSIADLFEKTFGHQGVINKRPTPTEWIVALDNLSKQIKSCKTSPAHFYYNSLSNCPWCVLESRGLVLFNFITSRNEKDTFDLALIWGAISSIPPPSPAILPSPIQAQPSAMAISAKQDKIKNRKISLIIFFATLFLTWGLFNLLGQAIIGVVTLLIGFITSIKFWIFKSKYSLKLSSDYQELTQKWNHAKERWDREATNDRFINKLRDSETAKREYEALSQYRENELQKLKARMRDQQMHYFLDSHQINKARIEGIGQVRKNTLLSYGIETAADITQSAISQVSGFGPSLSQKLLNWRKLLESEFVFDSSKGVDKRDLDKLELEIAQKKQKVRMVLDSAQGELLQIKNDIENKRKFLLEELEKLEKEKAQINVDKKYIN